MKQIKEVYLLEEFIHPLFQANLSMSKPLAGNRSTEEEAAAQWRRHSANYSAAVQGQWQKASPFSSRLVDAAA